MQTFTEASEDGIRDLLVGRRIVKAEEGNFTVPEARSFSNSADGKLTLDDGTVIFVRTNEGCGGCSAGWYEIEHLSAVENVITSVRLDELVDGEDRYEPDRSYRIYVIADNEEINAVQVDGNDGNGYYGTGYELIVIPAEQSDE